MRANFIRHIFPKTIDNNYRGNAVALILFIPITVVTIARSLIHIFAEDGGAQSIATIPLDSYGPEASQAVITFVALWGLSQILLAFVYLMTIFRYKSLIPLMYLLVVVEYLGRHFIITFNPIETLGTAPGATVNLIMAPIALILMLLAIPRKAP